MEMGINGPSYRVKPLYQIIVRARVNGVPEGSSKAFYIPVGAWESDLKKVNTAGKEMRVGKKEKKDLEEKLSSIVKIEFPGIIPLTYGKPIKVCVFKETLNSIGKERILKLEPAVGDLVEKIRNVAIHEHAVYTT